MAADVYASEWIKRKYHWSRVQAGLDVFCGLVQRYFIDSSTKIECIYTGAKLINLNEANYNMGWGWGSIPGHDNHYINKLSLNGLENVRVTGIENGKSSNAEKLTAGGSELVVATLEVVHSALGKHGVVLQLRLAEGRSVTSNDHKLGLSLTERLDGGLVTKGVLSGLDNKGELLGDSLGVLLSFRGLVSMVVLETTTTTFTQRSKQARQ